mmetsp:Transcript_34900/g.56540  ORF Transcript_34900/g.56540 Transcript_34900/m.56540 type:complete len:91 (+) Transcript_34900:1907-2179(+)
MKRKRLLDSMSTMIIGLLSRSSPWLLTKKLQKIGQKSLSRTFKMPKKTGRPDIVTKEDHVTLSKMKEAVMMSIFQIIEDARNPNAYLPNS